MATRSLTATIPAGKAVSTAIDCSGSIRVARLIMPPAWTAAPLTFCLSPDDVAYHDLYHTPPGSLAPYEVTVPTVTPNAVVAMPPSTGATVAWFKIRSGTAAVAVNQQADRVFEVIVEVPDEVAAVEGPTGPAGPAGPTGVAGPTGTANLKGTVAGDDAATGDIGEFRSAQNVTGVPLTTLVTANVVALALPAGDWTVAGVVIFTPVGTGPNSVIAAISGVSATLPTDSQVLAGGTSMFQAWSSAMPAGKTQTMPVGVCRINVSVSTTVYLVAQSSFGGGSVTVNGRIMARRTR